MENMAMKFEGESFRRAMMYWDIFSRSGQNMAPKQRQACLELYFYWREVAIERETEVDARVQLNRARLNRAMAATINSLASLPIPRIVSRIKGESWPK
jgi:hypothetical protein